MGLIGGFAVPEDILIPTIGTALVNHHLFYFLVFLITSVTAEDCLQQS